MIPFYILTITDDDDREFMAAVYEKYEKILYSAAVNVTHNYWDAQDVVQSVLVKVIQDKIPLLKSLPERKLINYLVTACHNTAINHIKKSSVFSPIEAASGENCDKDTPDDISPSLEDFLLQKEDQDAFLAVWDSLDERTKYFLNARYILEQSTAEIASELHTSQAQVRTYLSRARKKALVASRNFQKEHLQ